MTPEFMNLTDSELLHYLAEDWHEQNEGVRLEEIAMKFDRLRTRLKSARELFLLMRGGYEHNEVSSYWRDIDSWLAEDGNEADASVRPADLEE